MKYSFYSDEAEQFLSTYKPMDDMFTSEKEMNEIIDRLCLDICLDAEDVRSVRNEVVRYYSDRMKSAPRDFSLMASMQSVTAVCDHYMVKEFRSL